MYKVSGVKYEDNLQIKLNIIVLLMEVAMWNETN